LEEICSTFHDSSIGVLHIDRLRTSEILKGNLDRWQLKLFARGVIPFHVTNELYSDFGAVFTHAHDLAVLCVGVEVPEALLLVLRRLAESIRARPVSESVGQPVERHRVG
jgi:hypothetical protein